jgi:hypothetical protein
VHENATLGRAKDPVYKRTAPNGSPCYRVADYATGKRRFVSYADEDLAIEAATTLARRTSDAQAWLDAKKKLSPQSHANFRCVLHLLFMFKFAVARGNCLDNAADGCERVKVR